MDWHNMVRQTVHDVMKRGQQKQSLKFIFCKISKFCIGSKHFSGDVLLDYKCIQEQQDETSQVSQCSWKETVMLDNPLSEETIK